MFNQSASEVLARFLFPSSVLRSLTGVTVYEQCADEFIPLRQQNMYSQVAMRG